MVFLFTRCMFIDNTHLCVVCADASTLVGVDDATTIKEPHLMISVQSPMQSISYILSLDI